MNFIYAVHLVTKGPQRERINQMTIEKIIFRCDFYWLCSQCYEQMACVVANVVETMSAKAPNIPMKAPRLPLSTVSIAEKKKKVQMLSIQIRITFAEKSLDQDFHA